MGSGDVSHEEMYDDIVRGNWNADCMPMRIIHSTPFRPSHVQCFTYTIHLEYKIENVYVAFLHVYDCIFLMCCYCIIMKASKVIDRND